MNERDTAIYNAGFAAGRAVGQSVAYDGELPAIQLDLLTVIARIYQSKDLIEMIDPMAARLVNSDAPRLCKHLSSDAVAWLERIDLDTGLIDWVAEQRAIRTDLDTGFGTWLGELSC